MWSLRWVEMKIKGWTQAGGLAGSQGHAEWHLVGRKGQTGSQSRHTEPPGWRPCTGNAHVLLHEHPGGPGTPLRWTAGYRNSPPVGREVLPLNKTGVLQTPEPCSPGIEQTFQNPSKWTTAKWPLCCRENPLCWANQVRHSGDLPGQTPCSVFDSGAWWHNCATGMQLWR